MTQGFEDNVNKIICGDAQMVMQQLPKAVFNCAITSPPYWGLRAYQTTPVVWGGDENCRHEWGKDYKWSMSGGTEKTNVGNFKDDRIHAKASSQFCSLCNAWRGELGLEPTPELYIDHLMTVFDSVKRVLRKDGVLFVNIGDTYGGSGMGVSYAGQTKGPQSILKDDLSYMPDVGHTRGKYDKTLMAIPERFVLAMMAHGWIRRCTIIWAKGLSFCETYSGSCMPDSCKDRPNKNGFEYVYMFTKSKKYFYEQVFEEANYDGRDKTTLEPTKKYGNRNYSLDNLQKMAREPMERWPNPLGRTIRNVWTINPQAFSEAHFATFPEKLVEICLKLGCPEFVCKKCGLPRKKVYKANTGGTIGKGGWLKQRNGLSQGMNIDKNSRNDNSIKKGIQIGLTDCGCGAGFRAGITFDPFMGSGTVALGAYKNRRDYCGIELSEEYVRMAEARLDEARQQYSLLEPNKEA